MHVGNHEDLITKEQVAKARKELPLDVFTPQTLLKRFPFEKKYSKKNGTYTPTFDDTLTNITSPVVYRTHARCLTSRSRRSFAGESLLLLGCRRIPATFKSVWTKGGFIKSNQAHWSSNVEAGRVLNSTEPPWLPGTDHSTQGRRLLMNLSKTNKEKPFYDTSQADDFPFID